VSDVERAMGPLTMTAEREAADRRNMLGKSPYELPPLRKETRRQIMRRLYAEIDALRVLALRHGARPAGEAEPCSPDRTVCPAGCGCDECVPPTCDDCGAIVGGNPSCDACCDWVREDARRTR
jgi:hypothetical protein